MASVPAIHRVAASLIVLALSGCGGSGGGGDPVPGGPTGPSPSPAPVATTNVLLRSSSFAPPSIVVAPRATVQFTNEDEIDHNVTFVDASIGGTGTFRSGSASLTMPGTAGTYSYSCTLHAGMTGSVKVE